MGSPGNAAPDTWVWDPLPSTISLQPQSPRPAAGRIQTKVNLSQVSKCVPGVQPVWATSIVHLSLFVGLLTSHCFYSCPPGHTAVTGSFLQYQSDHLSPTQMALKTTHPNSPSGSSKPHTCFPLTYFQLGLLHPLSHFLPRIHLPPQGLCTCYFLCQNPLPGNLPMSGFSSMLGSQSKRTSSGRPPLSTP